jgi:AcrR family transcriptional regulator
MPASAPSVDPATRQRLLDAAGEIFAEQGFRSATVRDICARAGANGAAVNYHFGGKQGLYNTVFQYAHDCAMERHPVPVAGAAKAAERLRAFVTSFLRRILDQGRPAWHGKLMAREMVEPTGVLDIMVAKGVRPQFEFLSQVVRELVGDLPPERLRRLGASVVAQCLFYFHARPVITRLFPDLVFDDAEIAALAGHITAFSLAGLAAAARAEAPRAKAKRKAAPKRKGRA